MPRPVSFHPHAIGNHVRRGRVIAIPARLAPDSRRHRRYHAVVDRDGAACAYCHVPLVCWCDLTAEQAAVGPATHLVAPDGARFGTLDHVMPRSAGGTNALANLTPSCTPCNRSKGDLPVEQYLAARAAR